MNLKSAVQICQNTGLTGWELVEYAQHLVNRSMKYSVENSFDTPQAAFEKGKGYCWHQASALNIILGDLGFDSRLVHAFKNLFPETEFMGVCVNGFVSGHVWCRVTINGMEKDVCPGNKDNVPGIIHFEPLSKVLEWSKGIELLTYYGAALFNFYRKKSMEKSKRNRKKGLPSCER